jgi:hypothetical protein
MSELDRIEEKYGDDHLLPRKMLTGYERWVDPCEVAREDLHNRRQPHSRFLPEKHVRYYQ